MIWPRIAHLPFLVPGPFLRWPVGHEASRVPSGSITNSTFAIDGGVVEVNGQVVAADDPDVDDTEDDE
jgi:hypothetical protein